MTIPPRFLDELRNRLALSDIVGRRVKLERAGMNEFKACCPFHKEKSPSFTVSDDKQFYHCFGCGAHGDIIGFVMQHDNLTFIEAVEALASQAGMQVPAASPQDKAVEQKRKDLHNLLEDTCKWFEEQLHKDAGRDGLSYLRERGVSDDLLHAFRIGYAPGDGQALWKFLKSRDYTEKQMAEAAVVLPSTKGGSPYSFFRERIIFPVSDRRGRVVAFGGRILPEHLRGPDRSGRKPPKYINSSDSPLFHKGRMLYGESQARQAAADGLPLIVVEGYIDVMSCFSAGYRGAVAPLGTALTEEQMLILWKMIPGDQKNPVLCFDGDNAGRRAAARAAERLLPLLQPDHSALFAFLPEGQDPDSLIRAQGGESFGKVLANAIPLDEFVWQHHTGGRSFETPEARAGLQKALEDEALRIADRTVQQYYRQSFRDKLYNTFSRAKFSGSGRPRPGRPGAPAVQGVKPAKPVFAAESLHFQILMAMLINNPSLLESVEEEFGKLSIPNQRLDLLRQTILNILITDPELDSDELQNHLKEQGFASELKAVLSESVYTHAGYARPNMPEDKLLAGWNERLSFIQKIEFGKELKAAGKALAQDFSPDNEVRMIALRNVHNEGNS